MQFACTRHDRSGDPPLGKQLVPVVLVTGGSGMLGRALTTALNARPDISDVLAPTHGELDLLNSDATVRWFATHRPSVVLHLAGHVRGLAANMGDQLQGLMVNARIALNVLEASARYPPERLVVAGSTAAYGHPYRSIPIQEDDLLAGDVHPGEYGYAWGQRTLIAGTEILRCEHGVTTSVALLSNLFGPGDRFHGTAAHAVPALIARCTAAVDSGDDEIAVWGHPTTTRDFLYIDDAARAMVALLDAPEPPPLVNVASGEERAMSDVVVSITRASGFTGRVRWDDSMPVGIPRRAVDTSRLDSLVADAPIGFDEGIQRTVAWYRANRDTTR